jgi:2-polyprenyl-6-methoxyphenol hydroxylase-like FAD-dependent oxidoreductase
MYDVIVVGARCAGSPTAMLLARKGYRVLLVDKATFPSDTRSAHFIRIPGVAKLKRLGVLDKTIASSCPPIATMTLDSGPFALRGMSLSVGRTSCVNRWMRKYANNEREAIRPLYGFPPTCLYMYDLNKSLMWMK